MDLETNNTPSSHINSNLFQSILQTQIKSQLLKYKTQPQLFVINYLQSIYFPPQNLYQGWQSTIPIIHHKIQYQYGKIPLELLNFTPQIQNSKIQFTFSQYPNILYFMERNLASLESQKIQKSLTLLQQFFTFMFCNPNHQIKDNEIINVCLKPGQSYQKFNIQLINAVIAKLLDLFLNCKIFAHKKYIADILINHSSIIKLALIKDEIVQVLMKGIKGVDQYTRIMTTKIIPSYTQMFEKDLIVFQYILHKVQNFDYQNEKLNISSIVEKQNFRQCLSKILQKSNVLSSLFIKNLEKQCIQNGFNNNLKNSLYMNQISIIRYFGFCLDLKLSTIDYAKLFKQILITYKIRSNFIIHQNQTIHSKLKDLITKIFNKFFHKNFKVLQIFYQLNMEQQIQLNQIQIISIFRQFDQYQQSYILQSCPQKLKTLLISNQINLKQNNLSMNEQMFMKFYSKINQFNQQINLNDINKTIKIKNRKLMQFKQISIYQKHSIILQIIDLWIDINQILLFMIENKQSNRLWQKITSIKNKFTYLAQHSIQNSNILKEEIQKAADVFLFLQKCGQLNKNMYFTRDYWTMGQKFKPQNKHFLKWTYFTDKTLLLLQFQ